MKYCTNCGEKLKEGAKFCTKCGEKVVAEISEKEAPKSNTKKLVSSQISTIKKSEIDKINRKITLQNNQTSIVKKSWYAAGFFLLIIIVAIMDFDSLPIHPAIVLLSVFFFISSLVIGFMFRSREEKLQSLISGESLLAGWTLNETQKKAYVNYLFDNEKSKNIAIFFSIALIAAVVFGIFILVIDEGKFAMFMVYIGLLVFLSFFAFGMPRYYKYQNSKNDGNILIGAKFAYINGYFHNWDFVLSGLSKVKIIDEPFYGIGLVYYYTDRTFRHSEALYIPANEGENLEGLVAVLKEKN